PSSSRSPSARARFPWRVPARSRTRTGQTGSAWRTMSSSEGFLGSAGLVFATKPYPEEAPPVFSQLRNQSESRHFTPPEKIRTQRQQLRRLTVHEEGEHRRQRPHLQPVSGAPSKGLMRFWRGVSVASTCPAECHVRAT